VDFALPSPLRRVVVISLYLIFFFVAFVVATIVVVPQACLAHKICSDDNKLAEQLLGLLWIGLNVLTIIAGWRGELLGCRLRPTE
jgi:sorbitol-specific phosphotransferase system component IIBC